MKPENPLTLVFSSSTAGRLAALANSISSMASETAQEQDLNPMRSKALSKNGVSSCCSMLEWISTSGDDWPLSPSGVSVEQA